LLARPTLEGVIALRTKLLLDPINEVGTTKHRVGTAAVATKLTPLFLKLLHDGLVGRRSSAQRKSSAVAPPSVLRLVDAGDGHGGRRVVQDEGSNARDLVRVLRAVQPEHEVFAAGVALD